MLSSQSMLKRILSLDVLFVILLFIWVSSLVVGLCTGTPADFDDTGLVAVLVLVRVEMIYSRLNEIRR